MALDSQRTHLTSEIVASNSQPRKYEVLYTRVVVFAFLHFSALYGLYLAITCALWKTLIFNEVIRVFASIGLTAGNHRLWSHRSYKAKMPLQIILMIFTSATFQFTVKNWVRDHRIHHKFVDTDADPHNASRGFFFSHIGWLLVKKHPDVRKYGKLIDMSDINENPVLRFQEKYAIPLIGTACFLMPTFIPVILWKESLHVAWHVCLLRYVVTLNITFLINSFSHAFGFKPYDKSIKATNNNFLNVFSFGEGFHNYHHVFPWDYRTAEMGNNILNITTCFIDFFAMIGWAYDLRSTPQNFIISRAKRTGDGTDLWGRLQVEGTQK